MPGVHWASVYAQIPPSGTIPGAIQYFPSLGTQRRQGLCSHFDSSPPWGPEDGMVN